MGSLSGLFPKAKFSRAIHWHFNSWPREGGLAQPASGTIRAIRERCSGLSISRTSGFRATRSNARSFLMDSVTASGEILNVFTAGRFLPQDWPGYLIRSIEQNISPTLISGRLFPVQ